MTQVTLLLSSELSRFYSAVAEQNSIPLEQVLTDALFKLAAELSLSALKKQGNSQR